MAQGQLNAGHLGGRFLERTIPQKVNSVPSCETEAAVQAAHRQVPVETNRRSRTSAAMLGLAVSMGACGLLHQPNDSAIAAEPASGVLPAAESSGVNIAAASHAVGSSPAADTKSSVIEHTVQEGQTLQQLSRFYGIDTVALANINGLPLEAVLHVGQVLKVPANSFVARVSQPRSAGAVPEYYGLVPGGQSASDPVATVSSAADSTLKVQQDEAVGNLHQKRDDLRATLSQMKVGGSRTPSTIAERPESSEPLASSLPTAQLKFPETASEPAPPALVQPSSSVPSAVSLSTQQAVQTAAVAPQKERPVVLTNSVSYQVSAGDTLSAIARSYSISEEQLAAANQITNPNLIRANQVLTIPKRQSDVSSASPARSVEPGTFSVASADVPVVGASTLGKGTSTDTARIIEARLQQAKGPATSSNLSSSSLLGVSPDSAGATPIATTSTGAGQFRPNEVTVPTTVVPEAGYSYVENLRAEVLRLRERYNASSSQPTAKAVVVSIESSRISERKTPEPVNPEFNPKALELTQDRQPKAQNESAPTHPRVQENASIVRPQPQKVATASLGSQSYSSLTSSMLGQIVSPNLPPLGSAEAYLPGKSGKFAGYIWPAQGMLSSGYGWRWGRMHKGIDIAAPVGTPIVAAAGGKVSYADWNSGGYGNLVEITHPDGSVTLYAHNNRILVREGQEVVQGEQIAEMGSTGYSTGPHSHFEVHLPGQGAVNPIGYLPGGGVS